MKSPKTDKQQEDLDLPYLTSHQQQDLATTPTGATSVAHQDQQSASQLDVPAGLRNDSNNNNNNKTRLASNLKGPRQEQTTANELAGGTASGGQTGKTSNTIAPSNLNNSGSSPILVSKSASSSSVLSSVSLASGAQMRPANQFISGGGSSNASNVAGPQGASDDVATALPQHQKASAPSEDAETGSKLDKLPVVSFQRTDPSEDVNAADKAAVKPEPDDEVSKTRQCKDASDAPQQEVCEINHQQTQLIARDPHIQTPKPKIRELKQLLRHTNSLNQLPDHGVETQSEAELGALMEQIDVWGLNIFEVHKFSQDHSLTVVMYKIFKVSRWV